MAQQDTQTDSLSAKRVKVRKNDLPLTCPKNGESTLDTHPRVVIPLKNQGDEASCPYCRTRYLLEG